MKTTRIFRSFCLIAVFITHTSAQEQTIEAPTSKNVTSFQSLVELLNADGVTHKTDVRTSVVRIPVEKGDVDGIMIIRWDEGQAFVHFIQSLMLPVSEQQLPTVEKAIVRLNHAMPYPGLGINHHTGESYYRMSLPVTEGGLAPEQVRAFFSSTLSLAARWRPIVQAVMDGTVTPEKSVEYHNALNFAKGEYTADVVGSSWKLNFDGKSSLTLHRDGIEVVQSTYEVRGNLVRFADTGGPMSVKTPGVYTWSMQDGKLLFRVVEDESDGRKTVLGDAPWVSQATK